MAIDVHLRGDIPAFFKRHFNFFRVHLLFFTLTPLVLSGIFYAANGSATGNANTADSGTGYKKVEYIDSLFLCFSAMTVTGLVTVNISACHPFQQAILFILFILGDYSVVSLVMVIVRKRFFRSHCAELLRNDKLRRIASMPAGTDKEKGFWRTLSLKPGWEGVRRFNGGVISGPTEVRKMDNFADDRPDLQRIDSPTAVRSPDEDAMDNNGHVQFDRNGLNGHIHLDSLPEGSPKTSFARVRRSSRTSNGTAGPQSEFGRTSSLQPSGTQLSRRRTVQIDDAAYQRRQSLRMDARSGTLDRRGFGAQSLRRVSTAASEGSSNGVSPRTSSGPIDHARHIASSPSSSIGFGGFPGPIQILQSTFDAIMPSSAKTALKTHLTRSETHHTVLQPSATFDQRQGTSVPGQSWSDQARARMATWLPENIGGLVVGRNSRFFTEELDDEEVEQLGGVEYRALRLLSYFVFFYILLFQVIPFAVMAIYLSRVHDWDSAFVAAPGFQAATVSKYWNSLFISVAAYTGAGMSLVDESMAPLATCYLVIYMLDIVMLAGNHALPMTLRLMIWLGTKITRSGSTRDSLQFLLDHPRRCFLYLFPSHQTWYLTLALLAFIGIELFSFLVLNIGLPVVTDIPNGWQLFSDGLLQSLSVRAAGFGIVSVAELAPSVLFLYVLLMYVAIYPIAMSVRSTNVYEEQALGVYKVLSPEDRDQETEPEFKGQKAEVFSKYLLWHMRRQLAFDIWPLMLGIFLICCCERGKMLDPERSAWFTVFRIIFECTSAYSTIGLSMGTPTNNYSFSGEFGTVSKLIMILIMLRGRHRGLPVAIDRAILLPHEYARIDRSRSGAEALTEHEGQQEGDANEGAVSSATSAEKPSSPG